MGTVPKKKVTGPVLNADKMGAPEVAVPVVSKTKKKVQSEIVNNKITEMSSNYKNPIEFSDAAYRNMYETGKTGLPVLFRGEGKPSTQRVLGDGGKYFAQTEVTAEQYGKVKAYLVDENAKILDIAKDGKIWNKIKNKNVSEELKKLGYDGVMDSKNYAHGTMIVNDSMVTEIPGVKSIGDLFKKVDNKKVSDVLKGESEDIMSGAKQSKSMEDYVKKYNAYPDGLGNEKMKPHALVSLKDIYPGEYDNWSDVLDLNKAKDNVYATGKIHHRLYWSENMQIAMGMQLKTDIIE